MNRLRSLLLLAAVTGTTCAWVARPARATQEGAPDPSGGGARLQGVASCAAAACHNANGPPGSRGSEYSAWAAYDPHSRAYRVLFDERSRRMVKNLRRLEDVNKAHPEKECLCLGCHVFPHYSDQTAANERFSLGDGVGCEACHGAAERWLTSHYRRKLTEAEKPELGMNRTRDLRVRAETCVRCHVGDGEMDVNHDLIAAGHPRLRFEYGAYLAGYPGKHWRTAADRDRNRDLEGRAWVLGQLVSAEAALKLLGHRAAGAKADDGKPWPEFAEYECAACHHALTGKNERQRRGSGNGPVGTFAWGTWYYPLLPILGEQLPGRRGTELLTKLDGLMRARVPPEDDVTQQARKAAEVLHTRLDEAERVTWTRDRYRELLTALASDKQGSADATWDGAAQRYLGIAAVYNGLSDLDAPFKARPGLKDAILGLRRHLEDAFPEGRDKLYNSPSRFDPATVAKQLRQIQGSLK